MTDGEARVGLAGGAAEEEQHEEEQHEEDDWLEQICRFKADRVSRISSLNLSIFFSKA